MTYGVKFIDLFHYETGATWTLVNGYVSNDASNPLTGFRSQVAKQSLFHPFP